MSSMYEKMYPTREVKKIDTIKIRIVFNVPYAYKDYAKEAKLFWNADLRRWYYDLRFESIEKLKEFIKDDEQEFKFINNKIFDFKIIDLIDDDNYLEGDEYKKLIGKFNRFRNIYSK